jgi:hypothetical protein
MMSATIALVKSSTNLEISNVIGMDYPHEKAGVTCPLSPVTVWDHAAIA